METLSAGAGVGLKVALLAGEVAPDHLTVPVGVKNSRGVLARRAGGELGAREALIRAPLAAPLLDFRVEASRADEDALFAEEVVPGRAVIARAVEIAFADLAALAALVLGARLGALVEVVPERARAARTGIIARGAIGLRAPRTAGAVRKQLEAGVAGRAGRLAGAVPAPRHLC